MQLPDDNKAQEELEKEAWMNRDFLKSVASATLAFQKGRVSSFRLLLIVEAVQEIGICLEHRNAALQRPSGMLLITQIRWHIR